MNKEIRAREILTEILSEKELDKLENGDSIKIPFQNRLMEIEEYGRIKDHKTRTNIEKRTIPRGIDKYELFLEAYLTLNQDDTEVVYSVLKAGHEMLPSENYKNYVQDTVELLNHYEKIKAKKQKLDKIQSQSQKETDINLEGIPGETLEEKISFQEARLRQIKEKLKTRTTGNLD